MDKVEEDDINTVFMNAEAFAMLVTAMVRYGQQT